MLAEFKDYSFMDISRIAFVSKNENQYIIGIEGVGIMTVESDVYERIVTALLHEKGSFLHDYRDENSDTYRKKMLASDRVKGISTLLSSTKSVEKPLEERQKESRERQLKLKGEK